MPDAQGTESDEAKADGVKRTMRRTSDNAAIGKPAAERFGVVVYLCTAPNAQTNQLGTACVDAASAYGWGVVATIEDRDGATSPARAFRPGRGHQVDQYG